MASEVCERAGHCSKMPLVVGGDLGNRQIGCFFIVGLHPL